MAVQLAGLSSLGVKFGYAVETTAGTKPAAFTQLERCNSVAGIALSTENIDASALEDLVTRYVPGRQDSGGQWSVTFNYTEEVETQLKAMISAYETGQGQSTPLNTWFEVWFPDTNKAFFVVAAPPKKLPMPEVSQNSLQTIELTFTINEYKGTDTAIEPTAQGVVLDKHTVSVADGNTTTLVATPTPASATVTWSSDNSTIATVAAGVVTGESVGKTNIKASITVSGYTYTDSCEVTVTA